MRKVWPSEGFDAADALSEGWNYKIFATWAKERAVIIPKPAPLPEKKSAPRPQVNITINIGEDSIPSHTMAEEIWGKLGIACTASGQPFFNMDNVRRCLENYKPIGSLIWWDEFHQKIFTTWKSKEIRPWTDLDDLNLCTFIQRNLGLAKMGIDSVRQGVEAHARSTDIRNEPRDWINTLEWDKEPRIHEFMSDCFGADYNEYTDAASKNFWVGMIARIYNPGCKLDTMIVLEGPQGTYKSSALEIIAGKWFMEMKESVQSKDFFQCLRGKLLVEISELDAFYRADVTRIKQVLSSRSDTYRKSYGRLSEDHPRTSIFVATTNEEHWQRDQTGARRFWPILCRKVNLEKIRKDREQLFAEALHAYKSGENWWEMPKEETEKAQEMRRISDEWEGAIYEWTDARLSCTIREIAKECLSIGLDKLDKSIQMRITIILRRQGWSATGEGIGQNRVWIKSSERSDG